MNLESKIEAILFFKNEPVSVSELAKLTGGKPAEVETALASLRAFYEDRGVVVLSDGAFVGFGTHPNMSELILNLQKEEISRELGRAGLETLAIILYKGPISRREIDHIRGVNSGFILRILLVRGLIERAESTERSYSYKATLKLMAYLGITRLQDLPEYENAFLKIKEFVETVPTEHDE
ncbi:MAG: SMC-Scp complex subunit ScpB [Parcubacteria group bacterium]